MAELKVKIVGESPLLMNNIRMADADDPLVKRHKAITKKQSKTEADRRELAEIEFEGKLYFDEKLGPYLPAANIEAALVEGGTISRTGAKLERALNVEALDGGMRIPLDYKGPREVVAMLKSKKPEFNFGALVPSQPGKKNSGVVLRHRPIFHGWSASFLIRYKDRVLSKDDVLRALTDAGELTGLMDWRPKFGKFNFEVIE